LVFEDLQIAVILSRVFLDVLEDALDELVSRELLLELLLEV